MKRTSLEEKEGEKKVGERDLMFRIRHPGIVPLLGVAESAKRVFLVTEYLECNLESVLESVGLLSESDATVVIRQVLRALFYLHEVEKIAHRGFFLILSLFFFVLFSFLAFSFLHPLLFRYCPLKHLLQKERKF